MDRERRRGGHDLTGTGLRPERSTPSGAALKRLWNRRRLVGRWLFGGPTPPMRGGRLALWSAVHLGMAVVGTIVLLLRLPVDQQNVLWAEDGKVFLADAFRDGFLGTVLEPYAGYMHLVPRTVAAIVTATTPLDQLGLAMNIGGAAVWSGVALIAFVVTRPRLQTPLRWLLWAAVLLIPLGSEEIATNVANSHWLLTFGLFVVILSRSGGTVQTVFGGIVIAAAVLSDPLTLIVLPFVLLRLLTLRGLRENIWSLLFVASAVLQLLVVVSTTRKGTTVVYPPGLAKGYVLRTVFGSVTGPSWGNEIFEALGEVVTVSLGVLLCVVIIAAIVLRWRRTALAAAAMGTSMVYFAVVGAMTWVQVVKQPLGDDVTRGGRYLVVGCLLVVLALISVANAYIPDRRSTTGPRRTAIRVVTLVLVSAALIAPGIRDFQDPDFKAGNYEMTDVIPFGREVCEDHPWRSTQLLQIAPSGWGMRISCDILLERG